MLYGRPVSRLWSFARTYGLDLLIAIAAVEGALEVALREDALRAPRSTAWFAVPAVAIMVLPLLGRRRWRFGAPVSVWLLAVAFSFVDGRLIEFTAGATVAGMAASFLLGQLPDARQARLGLAVAVGCAAIVVSNDPNHAAGDFLFIPALFAIAWLVGFALRERVRAGRGGGGAREPGRARARGVRPARGGRGARADRPRAARRRRPRGERHGAPRRRRPAQPPGRPARRPGRAAAGGADRPHRARRDAAPARRDARATATTPTSRRSPGLGGLEALLEQSAAPASRCACTSTASPSPCRARSTCRPTGSSRRV